MKKVACLLVCYLLLFMGVSDAQAKSGGGKGARVTKSSGKPAKKKKPSKVRYGTASFYASKFNGRKTASGELFSQKKLTAAQNSVALGTYVRVTNLKNNKSVVVKVNDRLHKKNRRLIDLSKAAAQRIGAKPRGLLRVKMQILGKTKPSEKEQ